MTRTKLGLLGLCAMMLSLFAFSACAQAETGAKWLILDANGLLLEIAEPVGGDKIGSATVNLRKDTNGVLHTKILGFEVLFECKVLTAENGKLIPNGSIATGGRIKFSECETFLNGVLSKECEPKSGGVPGVIKTELGHGLLVLHKLAGGEVDDLVNILPDNVGGVPSKKFATIELETGCPIGTKVPVLGKLFLKDCEKLALMHLIEHLVEVGPLTELWTIAETAGHEATLLGSAWAFLTGTDVEKKWSGDPA